MTRRSLVGLIILIMTVLLALSGCGGSNGTTSGGEGSAEGEAKSSPIELKVAGFFPPHVTEWEAVDYLIEKVNDELAGQVVLTKLGGPEVIPANEQPEALRIGTIDLIYAPAAQWVPLAPEMDALKLAEISPMDMRKGEAYNFIDQILQEKANAKFVGIYQSGFENFAIFTNDKLEKADLSGQIMRSIPIYEPLLLKLGASIVSIPLTEVSNAMDRGVITAFCYSLPGAEAFGFDQVAKYVINPGFYAGEAVLAMNLDAWNQLPADVQDKIMQIAAEAEEYGWQYHDGLRQNAIESLSNKGVEFIDLPPGEREKFIETAVEAGWEKVQERTPENYQRLRELLTK